MKEFDAYMNLSLAIMERAFIDLEKGKGKIEKATK